MKSILMQAAWIDVAAEKGKVSAHARLNRFDFFIVTVSLIVSTGDIELRIVMRLQRIISPGYSSQAHQP